MLNLRSRVGLGTAPLGSLADGPLWWGPQDRDEAVATIRAALDAGIDWVDTAPFYGWGRAEELVGDAVSGRRDGVTILTKCGTVRRADGTWHEDGSPAAVRADLESSLRRLRTDHVDALQLHDPDPAVPVEETVGAMAELVTEGKVRAIGLSNHPADLLVRGAAIAPIAVVQHQWSILHHGADAEGRGPGAERPAPSSSPGRRWRRGSSSTGSILSRPLMVISAGGCHGHRATELFAWRRCVATPRLLGDRCRTAPCRGSSTRHGRSSAPARRARLAPSPGTGSRARPRRRQRSTAATHRSILVIPDVDPVQW